jgi:hypothetical protein
VVEPELNSSAIIRVLGGIGEKVRDDLLEPYRIAAHTHSLIRHGDGKRMLPLCHGINGRDADHWQPLLAAEYDRLEDLFSCHRLWRWAARRLHRLGPAAEAPFRSSVDTPVLAPRLPQRGACSGRSILRRLADAGGPKRCFIDLPRSAALEQPAIDNDGRHAANTKCCGTAGHRRILHVQDADFAGRTSHPLNQRYRVAARRAAGTEYFNGSLGSHD